jgi:arginase
MKNLIIGAGSDLGVHIDGAHLGPTQLINDVKTFYHGETICQVQDESIIKSRNLSDRRKNEYEIDRFNTTLYKTVLEKERAGYFPIILGGDHSIAVASCLADAKVNGNIGLIWFDAHTDYNTFETTVTGNIHGLPLAAITGYKTHELRYFYDGQTINPAYTVVVGARSIDDWEKDNVKYSGITVFTTQDIKEKGAAAITEEAFKIAGAHTNGVHVSYDLDLIDPEVAPGVSIPEIDGINEAEAMEINETIIRHMKEITAYELVEFNPLRDVDRKTEQIALNILSQTLKAVDNKQTPIIKQNPLAELKTTNN